MTESYHTPGTASSAGENSRPVGRPPRPRKRLLTFNDPRPLRVDRSLAVEIGFLESLVLLQIEYHISTTNNERAGEFWTYQTLEDLRTRDFPWLSTATISRTLQSLERRGLIKIRNFNRNKMDRTQWFALDYGGLSQLQTVQVGEDARILQEAARILQNEKCALQDETPILQNARSFLQNAKSFLQDETTIPKNSPKENTKNLPQKASPHSPLPSGPPACAPPPPAEAPASMPPVSMPPPASDPLPSAEAPASAAPPSDPCPAPPPGCEPLTGYEKFKQTATAQEFNQWRQQQRLQGKEKASAPEV
jgi:hypothetical protein